MRFASLIVLLLAGCPSEGGVSFSYGIYLEGTTPTLAASCAAVSVVRVRFAMGNDTSGDGNLSDDEAAGRAVEDCNQMGTTLGRYETAIDRLPAGEYDTFAISFVPFIDATTQSRYFTSNNYADVWSFRNSGQTVIVIEEGKITNISFATFQGGTPELRMVLQP